MAIALRILVPVLLVAGFVWALRRLAPRDRHPCADCRFCRKVFDDGTLCGFGSRETFKNPTHVKNCMDYRPRAS